MSRDLPQKRIIAIVVEHEATRRLLSFVLEEEGFKVLQVDASACGLDFAAAERPDVILLDAQLHTADSYALCRDLSDRASLRGARVIMFGNECTSLERLAGLRAGAEDFISGPFDYGELLARIKKH